MIVCFHCGAANSPGKTHCHSCQAPLPGGGGGGGESSSSGDGNDQPVVCLHCGERNTGGTLECPHCGAGLPRMDHSTQSRSFDTITERYDQFRSAGMKAKSGEWSRHELQEWLGQMSKRLAARAQFLIDTIRQTGYYDYRSDEVDMGMTGVLDYEEGMELMRQFVEDGNPLHIDDALEKIWEGNEKINEAMRMNREFRRQLEEEWGYM